MSSNEKRGEKAIECLNGGLSYLNPKEIDKAIAKLNVLVKQKKRERDSIYSDYPDVLTYEFFVEQETISKELGKELKRIYLTVDYLYRRKKGMLGDDENE